MKKQKPHLPKPVSSILDGSLDQHRPHQQHSALTQSKPPKAASPSLAAGADLAFGDRGQKKMNARAWVVAALFVVVMLWSINTLHNFFRPADETFPQLQPVLQAPLAKQVEVHWERPAPLPVFTRDPMTMIGSETIFSRTDLPGAKTAAPQQRKFVVRAIVSGGNRSSALIGDKILHEGDTLSGVTIARITGNTVEFKSDGRKWVQQVQQ